MKIGIISDSHDNLPLIQKALARLQEEGAQALIHAGDFVAPFAVRAILKFPGRTLGVFGNNDGERKGIQNIWAEVAEPPKVVVLGSKTIVIVHDRGQADAETLKSADVLICGHTHKPLVEKADHLIINPGECGGWVTGRSTCAVLDTAKMEARILDLS